jgi:hypothetical protein
MVSLLLITMPGLLAEGVAARNRCFDRINGFHWAIALEDLTHQGISWIGWLCCKKLLVTAYQAGGAGSGYLSCAMSLMRSGSADRRGQSGSPRLAV